MKSIECSKCQKRKTHRINDCHQAQTVWVATKYEQHKKRDHADSYYCSGKLA